MSTESSSGILMSSSVDTSHNSLLALTVFLVLSSWTHFSIDMAVLLEHLTIPPSGYLSTCFPPYWIFCGIFWVRTHVNTYFFIGSLAHLHHNCNTTLQAGCSGHVTRCNWLRNIAKSRRLFNIFCNLLRNFSLPHKLQRRGTTCAISSATCHAVALHCRLQRKLPCVTGPLLELRICMVFCRASLWKLHMGLSK